MSCESAASFETLALMVRRPASSFETLALLAPQDEAGPRTTLAPQDEDPHAEERTKCASRSMESGRSTLAQELHIFLGARSHLIPFGGGQRHLAQRVVAAERGHFRERAI